MQPNLQLPERRGRVNDALATAELQQYRDFARLLPVQVRKILAPLCPSVRCRRQHGYLGPKLVHESYPRRRHGAFSNARVFFDGAAIASKYVRGSIVTVAAAFQAISIAPRAVG